MRFKTPRNTGWILISLGFMAICLAFWQWAIDTPVNSISQRYEIPPSFNGIRLLYGATLAILIPMSLFSAGLLLDNFRYLVTATGDWHSPAKVSVVNDTLLLATIFVGVSPDAVVLLAWGEQSAPSASLLAATDRALDMLSGLLFLYAIVRRIRSRAVVLFMLQREPVPIDMEPTWDMLWPKLRIGIVVVILSFGVAFAK